ncbi:MAG: putative serine/threonine-protein kinase pkwA [Deltaproteobacteria bacterium]|nr:putative serine/threonine-protein kinase pkwA [Deltaproteobacteria bacterium]
MPDRIATVALIAIIALIAGCWTGAPPPSPSVPAPAAPRVGFPLHSVWMGRYRCNQGVSAARLTIDAEPTGHATIRYEFGPIAENPDQPSGAYELEGTLRNTGGSSFEGEFEARRWIEQPDGYFMVGLTVETVRSARRLRGTLDHESCSDFEVHRVR